VVELPTPEVTESASAKKKNRKKRKNKLKKVQVENGESDIEEEIIDGEKVSHSSTCTTTTRTSTTSAIITTTTTTTPTTTTTKKPKTTSTTTTTLKPTRTKRKRTRTTSTTNVEAPANSSTTTEYPEFVVQERRVATVQNTENTDNGRKVRPLDANASAFVPSGYSLRPLFQGVAQHLCASTNGVLNGLAHTDFFCQTLSMLAHDPTIYYSAAAIHERLRQIEYLAEDVRSLSHHVWAHSEPLPSLFVPVSSVREHQVPVNSDQFIREREVHQNRQTAISSAQRDDTERQTDLASSVSANQWVYFSSQSISVVHVSVLSSEAQTENRMNFKKALMGTDVEIFYITGGNETLPWFGFSAELPLSSNTTKITNKDEILR
jgi:hypothetical protein